MELDILCTPSFSDEESEAIDNTASKLGITREEVIRNAVKFFVGQCVPTHGEATKATAA